MSIAESGKLQHIIRILLTVIFEGMQRSACVLATVALQPMLPERNVGWELAFKRKPTPANSPSVGSPSKPQHICTEQ